MTHAGFDTVRSADGTAVAFERLGEGPPLLLIGGAMNDRRSAAAGLPLAILLAGDFSAIAYDRRGRGDSGDTPPYEPAREVEDVAALVAEIGEPVYLFGHSSGAGLALEAALAGIPVRALAVYEPPYASNAAEEAEGLANHEELTRLIAAGRRGDAVAHFMAMVGMPPPMIEGMKQSPFWPVAEAGAHTLAYDTGLMRLAGNSFVPEARLSAFDRPLLAMAGVGSPERMKSVGQRIADAAPQGRYREIADADHTVPPARLADELREFFTRLPPD